MCECGAARAWEEGGSEPDDIPPLSFVLVFEFLSDLVLLVLMPWLRGGVEVRNILPMADF